MEAKGNCLLVMIQLSQVHTSLIGYHSPQSQIHTPSNKMAILYLFPVGGCPCPLPHGMDVQELTFSPHCLLFCPLPSHPPSFLVLSSTLPLSQLTATPSKPTRTNPNHKQQHMEPKNFHSFS